jgi:bifunctional non-homologous end joining protein LigD
MSEGPYTRLVEVRAGAWFEYGLWYARIEFVYNGHIVGEPRIYRDQPQQNRPQAFALACGIAQTLEGTKVSSTVPQRPALDVTHRDLAILTAAALPFSNPAWLFELKYDGYRVLTTRNGIVRLVSRHGRDLTAAFPEVSFELSALPPGTALDGELVILDAQGGTSFDHLARARRSSPHAIRNAVRNRPATLMVFDILADAGTDVRSQPIEQRKALLAERVPLTKHLRPVLPIVGNGEWLYAQAESLRLEGIVAKKTGTPYPKGQTRDWLAIRTPHGIEVDAKRFEYRRRP